MVHIYVVLFRVLLFSAVVLTLPLSIDAALASRPLTLDEQAHVNVLRKYRPDLADKLTKRLEKLEKQLEERPDLTEERKDELRFEAIDAVYQSALKTFETAKQLGTREQQLEAATVLSTVLSFKYRYARRSSGPNPPKEVYSEHGRLLEERKKAADVEKRDGIAPEHSSAGAGFEGWSFAFNAGIGERSGKTQTYLATEFAAILDLGVVDADREVTEYSWDAALRYAGEFSGFRLAANVQTTIEPYFSYRDGSSNSSLGNFDPGPGVFLGIPGTGDPTASFPAGIALSDVVSNDVSDMRSTYDFRQFNVGVRLGQRFESLYCAIEPFVGLGYSHTREKDSFIGAVTGWGIDFAYDTRSTIKSFNLDLGFKAEKMFGNGFSIFAEPSAGLSFVSTDGTDRLELSGLVSDQQRVGFDGRWTKPGVQLRVGFGYEFEETPAELYVGAQIRYRPDSVTVFRSGELGEESEPKLGYSTSYGVTAGLTFAFSPPPP